MVSDSHTAITVLQSVFDGLQANSRSDGLGQIIQVMSASSHAGTSHVARNLSLIAARQMGDGSQRVGLFDCDFSQLAQTNYFFAAQRASQMQGPYDASFGAVPFWQVSHSNGAASEAPNLYGLYIEAQSGLAITSLFWDQITQTDKVTLRRSQAYWQTLRSHFSFVFIDTPALDRTDDGLLIAPDCDQTILVAKAENGNHPIHNQAREQIIGAGGRYAGLLLNAGAPMRLINPIEEPTSIHNQTP